MPQPPITDLLPSGETVLILRTCGPGGEAYGGFVWPLLVGAEVVAPDWDPERSCGHGLHGLLWGEGGAEYLSDADSSVWMVLEAPADSVVDIDGKVKVPRCRIVHIGKRGDAVSYLLEHGGGDKAVCFARKQGGDHSTLTGGVGSTITGGAGSAITGGDGSTITGGDHSTLTGGYLATLTGGDHSTLTGGGGSTLTGGVGSTITGGVGSTITGGVHSTITGGDGSTFTGGEGSTITFTWWDDSSARYRPRAAEVGEGGILPDVPYICRGGVIEVSP